MTLRREIARLSLKGGIVLFAIACLLCGVECTRAAAGEKNVALGRPYEVLPAPDYEGATDPGKTALTDGVPASGSFWAGNQSLGWTGRSPVTVKIGLAAPVPVGHVRIHASAKASGGAYYPSQILVFGGDGQGGYGFLGTSALHQDRDNPQDAETRAIDINFPARQVSQIVAVGFARGLLLYLSEIEVFSADGGTPLAVTLTSPEAVRDAAIELRRTAIAGLPGPRPAGPDPARRWAMPLAAGAVPQAAQTTQKGCLAIRTNPWKIRGSEPDGGEKAASLVALTSGSDYAAWRIVNRSDAEAKVAVSVSAPAGVKVRLNALAAVQALNFDWVADAAVPFAGDAYLPPRSEMAVILEAEPQAQGNHTVSATVTCGEESQEFAIPLIAIDPAPDIRPLHGNLWVYLHEPLHAPVARAIACDPDFFQHFGIDTTVVHPDALRDIPERPTALLRRYLRAYRHAARVLIAPDFKTRPWPLLKLPDAQAAAALKDWWTWVEGVAREEGVEGELLLYPIDEPQQKDVALLLKVRDLARAAGIEARFYSTVEWKVALRLTSLDVLQLSVPTRLTMLPLMGVEIQGYDGEPDSKLLSPDRFYRRRGWEAFDLGLAGAGIWSLWDSTGLDDPATGWNPFGVMERDFGLLYSSPEGCAWPSLRLLAWKRGLEENRILRQCAARLQDGSVSSLVKHFLQKGDVATEYRAVAARCLSAASH